MSVLEVEGLAVPFGHEPGLREISFTVGRGERFVLVGASGAGKTSLLNAIVGSLEPSAGRVRIGGDDVTRWTVNRRPCVLLSQTPLLFPHLTVFENVAFPLRVRRVPSGELKERVEEALAAVRMSGYDERRPATLSGGQARRVALARAVVSRPPVLLLDEPLSALDATLKDEVRRTILDLHADYRPALVMVTHDLAEAGRIGDRIGVLVGGTLAQVGMPEEIFRGPATLEVARFLGLPNELDGVVEKDGALRVGGVCVPRPNTGWSGNLGTGPDCGRRQVRVVFGPDGAELAAVGFTSNDGGACTGRVEEVVHRPDGVNVRVRTELGVVELGVSPDRIPAVGRDVALRLRAGSVHLYGNDAGSSGGRSVPS
ncbi:MAG: ABC transporter ATP-binding protein [Gemmatimonadota bacterium]|nr:ABC transporter ATP-binding protein [Gemmatimonadota bacterium]